MTQEELIEHLRKHAVLDAVSDVMSVVVPMPDNGDDNSDGSGETVLLALDQVAAKLPPNLSLVYGLARNRTHSRM